ncbi:AIM24 family protein [Streptomyces carpaticus]|uniref:AIM24 family protein n=1 Tax=Streptomyces carpaticus TaxID=285558 RepID=A0ABV4ZP32_9ACTN
MDQHMVSGHAPTPPTARMENHGPTMAKIAMRTGADLLARTGSMVAYEGFVQYESNPAALRSVASQWLSGESVPLMRCHGDGILYLADYGAHVVCVPLNDENLSVNATNVLAFDAHLEWGVQRVKGMAKFTGQGLFNFGLSGTGWVAVTSRGVPVVIDCARAGEIFVDPDALVAWSTGLEMKGKRSFKASSLIGRGSGEAYQLAFSGEGFVIVQPSEDSTERLTEQQHQQQA